MSHYYAEFFGTMILILLGDGVVANVCLSKTKGNNSGWIVIAFGWAFAVGVPAYIFGPASGASFNPALTLGLAAIGNLSWSLVPGYILAELLGAMAGAILVWLMYFPHWEATEDKGAKLAVFCTGPAIRNTPANFFSEFLGTFVLVFALLGVGQTASAPGFGPLIAAFIILVIGLSLGGTTGYAINPARDLGPRLIHAIFPIAGKGDSDWGYAWIPVVAPICGGILGALAFVALLG
ncbi:MIP/aquaporin family protein [Clostridium gasigenes]|uniref:MIP/aquaporin family protein n=1 Tax=Clostridium gasigenes TaxID=94869 RepID=UPI001C0C51AA|nr:MIP/aquaporin family protein [Clostridium gasigenes]MBU3103598.1 aquaporin family protein [Clostridium gasigenes]MBU3137760.1 aquaporin family protein [Clostridium gasigenes]